MLGQHGAKLRVIKIYFKIPQRRERRFVHEASVAERQRRIGRPARAADLPICWRV
jgi:hypothetical protein